MIFPSTPRFSKCFLPFMLSDRILHSFIISSKTYDVHRMSHPIFVQFHFIIKFNVIELCFLVFLYTPCTADAVTHGRGEKRVQGFSGKAWRKSPLERPRHGWENGIKMDLGEIGWGVWIGFTWLRIGIVGGLLWMRWWTFGFWRHGVS
jgi:hypothetical protein